MVVYFSSVAVHILPYGHDPSVVFFDVLPSFITGGVPPLHIFLYYGRLLKEGGELKRRCARMSQELGPGLSRVP